MGVDISGSVEGELNCSDVQFGFEIKIDMDDFHELVSNHWGCEVEEDDYEGTLDQIIFDNPYILSHYMNTGNFSDDFMEIDWQSVTLKDNVFHVCGDMEYCDTISFSISSFDGRFNSWQDDLLSEIQGNDHSDFDYGDFRYNQKQFSIESATFEGETDMGDDFEETY